MDDKRKLAIVSDLDGTLFYMGQRDPYDATHCEKDEVNEAVRFCLEAMEKDGCQLIFVSARENKDRAPTERAIRKAMNWSEDEPLLLYMRQTGDFRNDGLIKEEIFDEHIAPFYKVKFWLDDRDRVVQKMRSLGISVWQVQFGSF